MTQQKPSSEAPAGRPPPGPNQTQERRILSTPAPASGLPGHFQEVAAPGYYVGGAPPVYYQAVAPQPPHVHPVGLPPLHPVSSFHHPQPQPQAVGYHPPQGHWNTGLWDCFEDAPNCCITLWCPCITFGQTAEIIDRGSSSCGTNGVLYALILMLTGCQCVYACMYRSKLKLQYDMPQNTFDDFCIHCWCHYCALCQEYRELQRRGFEVTLGWHGNMERMNRGMGVVTNPPIVQGGMTR